MNYFDWLRITEQEDNTKNFIYYLITQKNYTQEEAKTYAEFIEKNGESEAD